MYVMKQTFLLVIVNILFICPQTLTSPDINTKKIIIVGASSGIGRALAKFYASESCKDKYEIGLIGRRTRHLQSLQQEIPAKTYIKSIDIAETKAATIKLLELIDEMNGLDICIITAGAYATFNNQKEWESTKKLISVDISGFTAIVSTIMNYFEKQGHGHLAGITSVDALRGIPEAPAYSAAKSYQSIYLEGWRNRMIQKQLPIYVTEIMPGWVDVEHTTFSEMPGTFWVASTHEAAKQIAKAIENTKKRAFITKRWIVVSWFMKFAPDWLFNWAIKKNNNDEQIS